MNDTNKGITIHFGASDEEPGTGISTRALGYIFCDTLNEVNRLLGASEPREVVTERDKKLHLAAKAIVEVLEMDRLDPSPTKGSESRVLDASD